MACSADRNLVTFYLNGVRHEVGGGNAFLNLAQFLRYQVGLEGTKIVCAEGDCGACTVLVSAYRGGNWSEFKAVNSCIAPVYLFDLCSIVTVEGLAHNGDLSDVQEKMMVHHGGQCGYCTPGIVCSLGHLAETSQRQGKKIDRRRAQNYLTGNLCRCTGYEPILKAAEAIDLTQWVPLSLRYQGDEMIERFRYLDRQSVEIDLADKKLWIPTTIEGVIDIKQDRPHVRLVSGATDLGVIHNKGRQYLDEAIVLNRIPELTDFQVRDDGVWIGSMVDLSTTERELEAVIPEMSRLLRIFASPQIKNQGTLVGNVLNGSPIGDSIPGLMVLEARLCLISAEGERWVSLGDFYKGYKKMDIRPEEICTGIMIPKPGKEWKAKFFKVSLRKDLDISSVTFAGLFKINDSRILEARIALGGVGPMVVRLSQLENELAGESFSLSSFEQVGKQASLKIKPISDLRASESYRRRVTENLFVKCFTELKQEVME